MQSFLISTTVVGLAEVGDKTQLLSLILAARYRKPVPILLGVLSATLINHTASGALGAWLASSISPTIINWAVVASFALMGIWILFPDKADPDAGTLHTRMLGVYGTTALTFFMAEMGDKTQVVTIALAARFQEVSPVVTGTTLGMMLANAPIIYLGHRYANRLPNRMVHLLAALIFMVLGGIALHTALHPGSAPMF
ncbi:MAG: TMEM165/GDT1 family protein [Janthinobacterium lividum]